MEHAPRLRQWIIDYHANFASIMDCDLKNCQKIVYDFSRTSSDTVIGNTSDPVRQTSIMWQQLAECHAQVGVGRYREDRVCYQSEQFKNDNETRSQHVGIDLFSPAGTPIYVPLDGVVHSFANNNVYTLNSGPTIILKHTPTATITFYTLYCHLSMSSLDGLYKGKPFTKASKLCELGDFPMNGNWIPHLHFQIIFDMLEQQGSYFGAVKPSEWDIWESICPNPNLILQMPENVTANKNGE